MSILQEIHKWSQDLHPWQQDAIRRLYANRTLSVQDLEDIYAIAKAGVGIEDPQKRSAQKLQAAQVAAPAVPQRLVQLAAIKNLLNVNALAPRQRLPISLSGLTVIFGENGAGKSGYSRALKQACRARSKSEPILPDARLPKDKTGPAQADFEALIDGAACDLNWTQGKEPPEALSEIAIFDSMCARAYVDNEGDFSYVPYGLDILEGLVKVCGYIKDGASREYAAHSVQGGAFAHIARPETEVGKLLQALSANTSKDRVRQLAQLSEAELQRLATLNRSLAEADPKEKAKALRNRASRLSGLASRIQTASDVVSDAKTQELQKLIDASNAAKQAAELAAKGFIEQPGLLPGTGGNAWKQLFEAARSFAAESHRDHVFPNLGTDASCPLCQNTLGDDGAKRLIDFDAFVQRAAEKTAREARAAAMLPFDAIRGADLNLRMEDSLADESPELNALCSAFQESLNARKASILQAAASKIEWDSIPAFTENPHQQLLDRKGMLEQEADALEKTMDQAARAAMVKEQTELDGRQRLFGVLDAVLEGIDRLGMQQKLKSCIDQTGTTGISRKSTDLSKEMATQEVADALNRELKALDVDELHVVMKSSSPGGKTQYKLELQLPGGGSPSDILSEGEQRAISIASFLAELSLSKSRGGIVFDDPVSSLDHKRRWKVAQRLAHEALTRQVIVFTHDVAFMSVLQRVAEDAGSLQLTQCIRRSPAGYGTHTPRLPFDTLKTTKRIGELRVQSDVAAQAHMNGDEETSNRLVKDGYFHLRMAWERAVEEVLLNGAISRFEVGISTKPLQSVVVEDDDYKAIEASMTKCSYFAHDSAQAAQLPIPHPDEFRADVEALESWRSLVEKRKTAVQTRRKQ